MPPDNDFHPSPFSFLKIFQKFFSMVRSVVRGLFFTHSFNSTTSEPPSGVNCSTAANNVRNFIIEIIRGYFQTLGDYHTQVNFAVSMRYTELRTIIIDLFFGALPNIFKIFGICSVNAAEPEQQDVVPNQDLLSRGFLSAITSAISTVSNIVQGIANGIKQTVNQVTNVISNRVTQAVTTTTNTVNQIAEVQHTIQKNTTTAVQGIANQILTGIIHHVDTTKNLTDAVASAFASHINKGVATTNYTLNTVVNLVEGAIDAVHKHVEILANGATNNTAILVETVGDIVKALVSGLNATKINQIQHLPNLLLTGVTDILTKVVNSSISLTKVNLTQTLVSSFVKTAGNVVDSLIDVLLIVTNKTSNGTKHNFGQSSTALLHGISGLLDNLGNIVKTVVKGTKSVLVDNLANKTDALVTVIGNLADLITDPAIDFTESLVDKLNITSTILVDKIQDVFGALFNVSTDAVETIVDSVHKTVNGTAVTLLGKIPKLQRLVTNTTTKLAVIVNDKLQKASMSLVGLMKKVGTNSTKILDKSLGSIGTMLKNITDGFGNIIKSTKNSLMSVVSTLGGSISTVAKGVIQLANNVTRKLGDFIAGKLDCAAELLPMMVKGVQGMSNDTVGCAVSKLSTVLGNVVKNTTELAGVTGKVFSGVTDHFEACLQNNTKKAFPQVACLTAFIDTTTNKTSMITEHLADTAGKLVESIIGTGNLTDCLFNTVDHVKDAVLDLTTCVLSNNTKSARSMRFMPYMIAASLRTLRQFEEDTMKILVSRPTVPKTDAWKIFEYDNDKEIQFDLSDDAFRSLVADPFYEVDLNADEFFDLSSNDDNFGIF
ncbi:hypothetical protein DMENIID0001_067610 [Sergentomyia squamirostris]